MEKVSTLKHFYERFKIHDVNNIDENTVSEVMNNLESVDKEVFLSAINVMPQLVGKVCDTVNSFIKMVEIDNKLSTESKDFYKTISLKILEIIQSENSSAEVKKDMKDLLDQVMQQMRLLDEKDAQGREENKKFFKNVTGMIGVIALALIGGKAMNKKNDLK